MNKNGIVINYWQKNSIIVTGVYELINSLKNSGIKVFYICQLDKEYIKKAFQDNIILFNVTKFNIMIIDIILYNIYAIFYSIKLIHKYNINRFHCINIGPAPAIILLNLFFKIKVSYNIRAPNIEFYLKYIIFLHRRLLKISERIFVISEKYKKLLVNNYEINCDKIYILPVGVNLELFNPNNYKKTMKSKSHYKKTKLLYVGTVDKNRKLDVLIKIMCKLDSNKVLLVIVGDGNDLNDLKNKVKKYNLKEFIIFTGRLPYKKIPQIISNCDIALSPIPNNNYYSMSSPLKTLEYMAMEKPVIASKIFPHELIFKDDSMGFLVDWNKTDHYVSAIQILIDNKSMMTNMGKRARKYVKKNYDYSIVYKEIINYFTS